MCWHRPSGGDVAGRVHISVARPCFAGHTHEHRLALAVFRCDMPTSAASLRRVCSQDPFEASRSFVVEPGHQPAPPLTSDCAVKAPFLCYVFTRLVQRAACRTGHRPHVEVLYSDGFESARQIGRGLFHPISSSVRLPGFEFRDRQLGARSAVGTRLGAGEALLLPAQPHPLTWCQARRMEQFPGRQRRRHRHTAIDTHHAPIARSLDGIGDVGEGDMPAPDPITSDAIGLHAGGHTSCPAESDPPDLRHPHPPVTPVELFDVTLLEPDLAETFVYPRLAPRRAAMGAVKEVPHSLREIPQRLLLHLLGPGRQPGIFGADLSQLRRLLVVPRGSAPWLPKLLLLDGQVPHEAGMPAMFYQHRLLSRCWQQSEPRHTRKVTVDTDTNGHRPRAHIWLREPA
jgi:hypothetical protein